MEDSAIPLLSSREFHKLSFLASKKDVRYKHRHVVENGVDREKKKIIEEIINALFVTENQVNEINAISGR